MKMKKRHDNASNEDRWARFRTLNELLLYSDRFSSNIYFRQRTMPSPSMLFLAEISQSGINFSRNKSF